eukprot:EG_transcript_17823
MLVQLIFHVPVLGSAFHLDGEVAKLALFWAIPWISISILPVEKIPGLEILQEIHQVGKFINMILLGLEKNLRTLPQIVLASFVLSVMAAVGEELLFRGAIQGGLQQLLTFLGANPTATGAVPLVVSSLLFGIVHNYTNSPIYAVLVTLGGMAFGGSFLMTDNLAVPMVSHFLLRVSICLARLQLIWYAHTTQIVSPSGSHAVKILVVKCDLW